MQNVASDPHVRGVVRDRHPLGTRLVHIGLALSIVIQLASSQVMQAPFRGRSGDLGFLVHEVAGFAALGFALLFWGIVMGRKRGAPLGLLMPWFSRRRLAALGADVAEHLRALRRARLPDYDEHAPLAAAVHGLGLLLMLVMAVTGTSWFVAHVMDLPMSAALRLDLLLHSALANLVWAYLIAHAALGLVHHLMDHADLRRMWSLSRD